MEAGLHRALASYCVDRWRVTRKTRPPHFVHDNSLYSRLAQVETKVLKGHGNHASIAARPSRATSVHCLDRKGRDKMQFIKSVIGAQMQAGTKASACWCWWRYVEFVFDGIILKATPTPVYCLVESNQLPRCTLQAEGRLDERGRLKASRGRTAKKQARQLDHQSVYMSTGFLERGSAADT